MTGYPPKCSQNGSRHHGVLSPSDSWDADFWPGDTYTCSHFGTLWRFNPDGTWTALQEAAKPNAA